MSRSYPLLVLLAACETQADSTTLDGCETAIDAGAPAFFQKYFACVDVVDASGGVTLSSDGLPPHPSPYWGEGDDSYVPFDDRGGTHFQNPRRGLAAGAHPRDGGAGPGADAVRLQLDWGRAGGTGLPRRDR